MGKIQGNQVHGGIHGFALKACLGLAFLSFAGCNGIQELVDQQASLTLDVPPMPSGVRGTTTLRTLGSRSGAPYGYVEYLPPGYDPSNYKYPLMIVLHGIGEEGNGTTQLASVRVNGPNNEIDHNGKDFPFVILTPQSPVWWNNATLKQFYDYAIGAYGVNTRRVYLTGLSMGGGGTWDFASAYPSLFAAIVPICGASGNSTAANAQALVSNHVAIWAAHARDDGTVGVGNTQGWLTAIGAKAGCTGDSFAGSSTTATQSGMCRTAGSNAWFWFAGQGTVGPQGQTPAYPLYATIYPSGGHGIWGRMYSDPKVYSWMLNQIRP